MVDWIAIAGNVLLFALVFGMSGTTDVRCIFKQMRNVKALLTGIFCQFIVLPFLGFVVVKSFGLSHAIGLTLLVVTSSPGGSYSNWWCSLFNGDLALSVTMTAISTILSIAMLPVNLLLYTHLTYEDDVIQNLDWMSLFTALAIVIVAIALGLLCSAKIQSRKFNNIANQCGNVSGMALIIFSGTISNSGDGDTKIWSRDWTFYVSVSLPCLGGIILANVIASLLQLRKAERVTVAIECCYQNVGIATSLALTMFEGAELNEAMGVPFFYGLMEAIIVCFYCLGAWKAGWTKAPRDAPLWKVIITSYEVLEYVHKDLNGIEVSISESDDNNESLSEDGNILTTYYNFIFSRNTSDLYEKELPQSSPTETETEGNSYKQFV